MSGISVAKGTNVIEKKKVEKNVSEPRIAFIDPGTKKQYQDVFFDGLPFESCEICDLEEKCNELEQAPCKHNGYLEEIRPQPDTAPQPTQPEKVECPDLIHLLYSGPVKQPSKIHGGIHQIDEFRTAALMAEAADTIKEMQHSIQDLSSNRKEVGANQDMQTLMEFSKELQEQPNHGQAFSYYWCPASEKLDTNIHGEGEVVSVHYDTETYSLQEYAELGFCDHTVSESCEYAKFLNEKQFSGQETYHVFNKQYIEELEEDWRAYIADYSFDAEVWTEDWRESIDNNPSFFLSDTKDYIKYNKHHLGRNPYTYAQTIHRMPKMAKLMEILYRLNPQPKETCNPEAYRIVSAKADPGTKRPKENKQCQ